MTLHIGQLVLLLNMSIFFCYCSRRPKVRYCIKEGGLFGFVWFGDYKDKIEHLWRRLQGRVHHVPEITRSHGARSRRFRQNKLLSWELIHSSNQPWCLQQENGCNAHSKWNFIQSQRRKRSTMRWLSRRGHLSSNLMGMSSIPMTHVVERDLISPKVSDLHRNAMAFVPNPHTYAK